MDVAPRHRTSRALWSPLEWARARPFAADSLLALLLAGVSMVPLWLTTSQEEHRAPSPWAILLVLAINLPLAWRRRWPIPVGLVVAAASIGYGVTPYPDLAVPIPLGALVAFYTVLTLCRRRTAFMIGAITCTVGLGAMLLPVTNADATDFAFVALLLGATWALGDSAATRRAYTAELEARADRLERERELEARRAAAEERARIARELHDVIAHNVSMMVVQAEAGPVAVERDPAIAAAAFDTIGATGRQALGEMRRLLGVLRSDDERSGPSLGPQPGLDQLPALVDQVRQAGLETRLRVEGEPRPLPPGMDLSAYRIVQEALTNAVRHAGPGTATVLVRYGDGDLRLEVLNDRRPRGAGAPAGRRSGGLTAPGSANGAEGSRARGPGNGSGHGLIGMRERVNLFGGELDAGPRPGGGFTVTARLPLASG
jgi:signal transduction histidine kinase